MQGAAGAVLDADVAAEPVQPSRGSQGWNVILWDDDDHSYSYIMKMLQEVCGIDKHAAYQLADEINNDGKAIVFTGNRQEAKLCCDRITAYGKDKAVPECAGSMTATLETV